MNKVKLTTGIGIVKGIFMITLALFHNIFILVNADTKVRPFMSKELSDEMILWFFVGGIYFAFGGIIDLISAKGMKNSNPLAWNIALASAIFSCVGSSIGIWVYREGPPFAIAFFGIIQLIPLILYRKELQLKTY
jgi:hypothetical protein